MVTDQISVPLVTEQILVTMVIDQISVAMAELATLLTSEVM